MNLKKWKISSADKQLANMLSEECDVDAFLALLAIKRGITEPYELEEFLSEYASTRLKEIIGIE